MIILIPNTLLYLVDIWEEDLAKSFLRAWWTFKGKGVSISKVVNNLTEFWITVTEKEGRME